jgi:hypothetical protein
MSTEMRKALARTMAGWMQTGTGCWTYSDSEGPLAFVFCCPFGWGIAWNGATAGLFSSKDAACAEAERRAFDFKPKVVI